MNEVNNSSNKSQLDKSLGRLVGGSCYPYPSYTSHSADLLAPVHGSNQPSTMEARLPDNQEDNCSPDCDEGELSAGVRDKLNLKNGVMNGIRLGTTDVQVHYLGSLNKNKVQLNKPALDEPSGSGLNKQLSKLSVEKVNSVNKINTSNVKLFEDQSTSLYCSSSSHEQSVNVSTSKHEINGSVCNGHSVSDEATGSTNSIATSDISVCSEKSSDSSHSYSGHSGARPRTRNASNSSSQSQGTQPRSDVSISSTSDQCVKTPEISISPVMSNNVDEDDLKVEYINYENERQMGAIMRLIQKDLSEPYSIYTYRYFIHNWPELCFLATSNEEVIGAIVCKLDVHKKATVRGYIAMLAVDHRYRKRKIGSNLVQRAIRAMVKNDADEVVLETEITNKPALRLYENLGFVRDKRLFRYYLNGVDALRLKLWLR